MGNLRRRLETGGLRDTGRWSTEVLLQHQHHSAANARRGAIASRQQQSGRGGESLGLNLGIDDGAKTIHAAVNSPMNMMASGASPPTIMRAPRPSCSAMRFSARPAKTSSCSASRNRS